MVIPAIRTVGSSEWLGYSFGVGEDRGDELSADSVISTEFRAIDTENRVQSH